MPKLSCPHCGLVSARGYYQNTDTVCTCSGFTSVSAVSKLRACAASAEAGVATFSLAQQPYIGMNNQFALHETDQLVAALQDEELLSQRRCHTRFAVANEALRILAAAIAATNHKPLAVDELLVTVYGTVSVRHTATFLSCMPQLKALDVRFSKSTAERDDVLLFTTTLAAVLSNGVLRTLRLCDLPPQSFLAPLADVLHIAAEMPSCVLRRVDVLSHSLTADFVRALCSVSQLTHLTLANSERNSSVPLWLEAQSFATITEFVERTTTLRVLDFRGNDASLVDFWPAVARSAHVAHVVVGVPDFDAVNLALAASCTALRTLCLCDAASAVLPHEPRTFFAAPELGDIVRSGGDELDWNIRNSICLRFGERQRQQRHIALSMASYFAGSKLSLRDNEEVGSFSDSNAHRWSFASNLVALVTHCTALRHLQFNCWLDEESDVRQFVYARIIPILRAIGHRNRNLNVRLPLTGPKWHGLSNDRLLRGVDGWIAEVRAVLCQVTLGLCCANLPTLVVLEVFMQCDVPALRVRNFDVLMWQVVALVRTKFVQKLAL